jgi:hypothetical protein
MSEWCYGTFVCNFIDVHKTSVAVPALSFTKLTVHNRIMCRSLVPNFIWMRQYVCVCVCVCMWTIWTGIHLYPCVEYSLRCTSICEHRDQSTFCVCLYQILSKLGGKYHVYPSVKYDCHWDDVHKTYPCCRTICTVFHKSVTHHSLADIGHGRNAIVSM